MPFKYISSGVTHKDPNSGSNI